MAANSITSGLIRRMSVADLERVLVWRNHASVKAFMYTQHEIKPQEHARWFEMANADTCRHLLIYEENGHPFGFINFTEVADGGNSVWGFYAAPEAPKGTGRRMGQSALTYGFEQAGFHKISGEALSQNNKSIRFHLALGFTQDGLLRDHFFDGCNYHDVVCLGLLAVDWRRHQKKPLEDYT